MKPACAWLLTALAAVAQVACLATPEPQSASSQGPAASAWSSNFERINWISE